MAPGQINLIIVVVAVICLLPLTAGCQVWRVFNGEAANVMRFTYAISLQVPQAGSDQFLHRCGGTLIARNLVLTAAHCVWLDQVGGETDFREQDTYQGNLSKALYAAVAPTCRHEEGWERLAVVRYYIPPNYWGVQPTENGQDIAVLVLERDVREDMFPNIMQIGQPYNKSNNDQVVTIGWGAQNELETKNQQQYAQNMPHLKSSNFQVMECDNETLISMGRSVSSRFDFDKSMLCAVSESADADICPGDSGGPLLQLHSQDPSQDVQIAVSMWAPNLSCSGASTKASVFTKVDPWIGAISRIITRESGAAYKSARTGDLEEPFMLPDFEQAQLQPVFLPSNLLLLQNTQSFQGNQTRMNDYNKVERNNSNSDQLEKINKGHKQNDVNVSNQNTRQYQSYEDDNVDPFEPEIESIQYFQDEYDNKSIYDTSQTSILAQLQQQQVVEEGQGEEEVVQDSTSTSLLAQSQLQQQNTENSEQQQKNEKQKVNDNTQTFILAQSQFQKQKQNKDQNKNEQGISLLGQLGFWQPNLP